MSIKVYNHKKKTVKFSKIKFEKALIEDKALRNEIIQESIFIVESKIEKLKKDT